MISVKALKLINLSREVAHELMAAEAGVDLTFEEFAQGMIALDNFYQEESNEVHRKDYEAFLAAIAESRSQKAS